MAAPAFKPSFTCSAVMNHGARWSYLPIFHKNDGTGAINASAGVQCGCPHSLDVAPQIVEG